MKTHSTGSILTKGIVLFLCFSLLWIAAPLGADPGAGEQNPASDIRSVTFYANGGVWENLISGIDSVSSVTWITENGKAMGEEMPPAPVYGGRVFAGWNSASDGYGISFSGETVVTDDIRLYALWQDPDSGAQLSDTVLTESELNAALLGASDTGQLNGQEGETPPVVLASVPLTDAEAELADGIEAGLQADPWGTIPAELLSMTAADSSDQDSDSLLAGDSGTQTMSPGDGAAADAQTQTQNVIQPISGGYPPEVFPKTGDTAIPLYFQAATAFCLLHFTIALLRKKAIR